MDCNCCAGKGTKTIRLGKPGTASRSAYEGVWCVFPTHQCPRCYGTGVMKDKPNTVAGRRIHLDADGWVTNNQAIGDDNV